MNFGWKKRLGAVLSCVWLLIVFLVSDEYRRTEQTLAIGVLPLIILLGIAWAVAGWREQRSHRPENQKVEVLPTRLKRNKRIRYGLTVLTVLVIGQVAAGWQVYAAGDEGGSYSVGYWFGECLVYGLIAYAVLRLSFWKPPGGAALLTAIVIVCGVNYKACTAISENREVRAVLAAAAPLLNKMQSGAALSDQDVKDARVGVLQPLMLAQAAFSRDIDTAATAYLSEIDAVHAEAILTPRYLATRSLRDQTRAKLIISHQATAGYEQRLHAATTRWRLGIQAAKSQLSPAMANGVSRGFEKSSAQLSAYVEALVSSEEKVSESITSILDLIDASPGVRVEGNGTSAILLFPDEQSLVRYRELVKDVSIASQIEVDARTTLMQGQTESIATLTRLLSN